METHNERCIARGAAPRQPARGSTMRTRTSTSSATTDGSAHWPSPTLYVEPLDRELAFGHRIAGRILAHLHRESRRRASCPSSSACRRSRSARRPGSFIADDWNVASGNRARVEPAPDAGFRLPTPRSRGRCSRGRSRSRLRMREVVRASSRRCAFHLRKRPSTSDAHLLRHEADLALVDQHALRAGAGRREKQHRERGDEGSQHSHGVRRGLSGAPRREHPGKHAVAIDQNWCLNAAPCALRPRPPARSSASGGRPAAMRAGSLSFGRGWAAAAMSR